MNKSIRTPLSRKFLSNLRSFLFVLFLLLSDFATLLLLILTAFLLRENLLPLLVSGLSPFEHPLKSYLWVVVIHLGVLALEGGYYKRFSFWDEVRLLWRSTFFTGSIVVVSLFLLKLSETYSRFVILAWLSLCFLCFPLIRTKVKCLLHSFGLGRERLLIVGVNERSLKFAQAVKTEPNLGYEVAGFLSDQGDFAEVDDLKVYRYEGSLDRYLKHSDVQTIAISDETWLSESLPSLLPQLHSRLRTVLYIPDVKFFNIMGLELRYFLKEDVFAFEFKNNFANPLNYIIKRMFDYALSLSLLPVALPLCLVIGLMIKLTSPGPVIFGQERIGKNGKPFRCYKFRTMYADAETRLVELLSIDAKVRAEWEKSFKLKEDPRVTPFGKFLRRTSLDELPQFFNILKGEMSLVGPRPVTKEELEKYYKEHAELYCLVPPGLTGLWQVSGRNQRTYEERVNLDSWYIKNWSLWLDVVILIKTVKIVLKGEGAY